MAHSAANKLRRLLTNAACYNGYKMGLLSTMLPTIRLPTSFAKNFLKIWNPMMMDRL
jgi:hypothetical protein